MKITSSAFKNGESIPKKYTCEGMGVSPPLEFIGVPAEAKSLALIAEDPDAPSKLWVHWIVFNISPDTKGFDENAVPEGCVEGLSTGNNFGYEGPCPPDSEHRYYFKLYALDKTLNLSDTADRNALLREMRGHVMEEASLMGKYEKEKLKAKKH